MKYFKEIIELGIQDGTIKKCERQIKYELLPKFTYKDENIRAINYVADFVVTYSDDSVIVWDVKGLPDATAKVKKKMFHYKYPDIDYRWIGCSLVDGGWVEYDVIEKGRRERRKSKNK